MKDFWNLFEKCRKARLIKPDAESGDLHALFLAGERLAQVRSGWAIDDE